jgi:hypothetical protein
LLESYYLHALWQLNPFLLNTMFPPDFVWITAPPPFPDFPAIPEYVGGPGGWSLELLAEAGRPLAIMIAAMTSVTAISSITLLGRVINHLPYLGGGK